MGMRHMEEKKCRMKEERESERREGGGWGRMEEV